MTPATLGGKDFESLIRIEGDRLHKRRLAMLTRYGTQTVYPSGEPRQIKSLPDFELTLPDSRQVVFDAKVESGPSFSMSKYREGGSKHHQLRYMLEKSDYLVPCGFLIHFNQRNLKTRPEPAATIWVPVSMDVPFWGQFAAGETSTLRRSVAAEIGQAVEWAVPNRCRAVRPDLLMMADRALSG